ncbi:MAG: heavy metal-associated domain-containing protein [Solirubrobacteraceae bacterium]|jgi:copper chaperone CopZ
MSEQSYTVAGMTCAHCVAAVSEQVSQIPGAEQVEVDLDSGSLVIRGEDIDAAEVKAAVEEAGYSLA